MVELASFFVNDQEAFLIHLEVVPDIFRNDMEQQLG